MPFWNRGSCSALRWLLLGILAGFQLQGPGRVNGSGPPVVDSDVRQAVGNGLARVLVEVRPPQPAKPEGELTKPGAVETQRAAIARAQRGVLSRLPRRHFSLVRQFETVPFLALEIDADALTALENMGDLVARVVPDRTAAPARRS